jgi:nuclear pore complex protein Nup188
VDTSPQAAYKIEEIKADTLWLSQKAGIDEVSALRITVQEWQSRPNTRLLGRLSEEEATSLQDATSVDSFRVSLAGPQLKEVLKKVHGGSDADYYSEKSRRIRLRNIYLSERSHILKISRKLLALSLHGKVPADAFQIPPSHQGQESTRNSLASLGEQIFKDKSGEAESSRFLLDAIKAIEKRITDFQTAGGWLSASESNTESENAWRTSLVDEIVHIMQIIFLHVQSSDLLPTGEVVLAWVRLMGEYSFMETINPVSTDSR